MATAILPEANSAAKRIIFERLEDAFESVQRSFDRVGALSQAIRTVLSHEELEPGSLKASHVATHLARLMDEEVSNMWARNLRLAAD